MSFWGQVSFWEGKCSISHCITGCWEPTPTLLRPFPRHFFDRQKIGEKVATMNARHPPGDETYETCSLLLTVTGSKGKFAYRVP